MRILVSVCALLLGLSASGQAEEYIGYLADQKCAKAGNGASEGHADCARTCVKNGEPIVFVEDVEKKIYKVVEGLELAESHVGHKVRIEGKLEGEGDEAVVKITSLKM
jgi:hypothetical protein